VSVHLDLLRRARLEGELFARGTTAPAAGEPTFARRHASRDQWQQLVHELFLRHEEPDLWAIGLASATAGEGTSYVAQHLTAELARTTGWSTLLLEANLDRPAQAQGHGVEPDPGLRRALSDRDFPVESCLRETPVDRLRLLPAGSPGTGSPHPDWTRFPDLLQSLRSCFRAVVVDLPPVNLSTDATIIGGRLDGLVLVVEAGLCSREVIQNAVSRLRRSNSNLLGSVLNKRKFVIPEAVYRRL
jgi:capsular exopolysaccharide synthesis family protein